MLKKLYPSLSLQQSLTITFICFLKNVRKLNTLKAFLNENRPLIFIQIFFLCHRLSSYQPCTSFSEIIQVNKYPKTRRTKKS